MMANKLKTKSEVIDLSIWLTQANYAACTGYKLGTVSQWVKRVKDGEGNAKIEVKDVPELGLTLVKKA